MSSNESHLYELSRQDAYSSFMQKHLQYYGYFTNKVNYRMMQFGSGSGSGSGNASGRERSSGDGDYFAKPSERENGDGGAAVANKPVLLSVSSYRNLLHDFRKSNDASKSTPAQPDNTSTTDAELARTRYQQSVGYKPARLFPFGTVGPRQPPLWPIELEVLPELRYKHLDSGQLQLKESYSEPAPSAHTGTETASSTINVNRVVFHYDPPSPDFFFRSRVGGNATGTSSCVSHTPSGKDDETLVFESRFESGNLAKAVQVRPHEYELWLRPDLYTKRHTQWYYFRVSNTRADRTYRLTIMNFYKSDSLYNYGMRPLLYSEKDAKQNQRGWQRCGQNIRYFQSDASGSVRRAATEQSGASKHQWHYALTFTLQFPHDDDTCFFAHCYPFTYSDLQDHIMSVYSDSEKSKLCRIQMLCKTLAGNIVYLLTIGEPAQSSEPARRKIDSSAPEPTCAPSNADCKRPAIVITARVHPGESNSSWMMKGLIDYLLSDDPDAKQLRARFTFKLVPMLNPDGVIVGNYRCCLAGQDLNRKYRSNLKEAYPAIWHTKRMVKQLLDKGHEVALYCDLHGHSRKHNAFMYGCTADETSPRRFESQLFPFMLSRNAPTYFKFESCHFRVQKNKMGTGRIAIWQLGVANSFTLEASFCGSSVGNSAGFHYSTKDFCSIASQQFFKTFVEFYDADRTKMNNMMGEVEDSMKTALWEKIMRMVGAAALQHISYADATLAQLEKIASRMTALDGYLSDDGSDDSDSSEELDGDSLPLYMQEALRKLGQSQKKSKRNDTAKSSKTANARMHASARADAQENAPKGGRKLVVEQEHEFRWQYKKRASTTAATTTTAATATATATATAATAAASVASAAGTTTATSTPIEGDGLSSSSALSAAAVESSKKSKFNHRRPFTMVTGLLRPQVNIGVAGRQPNSNRPLPKSAIASAADQRTHLRKTDEPFAFHYDSSELELELELEQEQEQVKIGATARSALAQYNHDLYGEEDPKFYQRHLIRPNVMFLSGNNAKPRVTFSEPHKHKHSPDEHSANLNEPTLTDAGLLKLKETARDSVGASINQRHVRLLNPANESYSRRKLSANNSGAGAGAGAGAYDRKTLQVASSRTPLSAKGDAVKPGEVKK